MDVHGNLPKGWSRGRVVGHPITAERALAHYGSLPSSPSNKQTYEREHENKTHSECGALPRAECPDFQAYARMGERNFRNLLHEQA